MIHSFQDEPGEMIIMNMMRCLFSRRAALARSSRQRRCYALPLPYMMKTLDAFLLAALPLADAFAHYREHFGYFSARHFYLCYHAYHAHMMMQENRRSYDGRFGEAKRYTFSGIECVPPHAVKTYIESIRRYTRRAPRKASFRQRPRSAA